MPANAHKDQDHIGQAAESMKAAYEATLPEGNKMALHIDFRKVLSGVVDHLPEVIAFLKTVGVVL